MNIGFATVANNVAYVQHLPIYLVVDTSRLFIECSIIEMLQIDAKNRV